MITIFKTGEFDYKDIGIDKPVRYSIDNLIDVASRTSQVQITKEHTDEEMGAMSNFIVEDGLLKAEEPNGLELKGMGFSPVFEYDLRDMGEYYEPFNIKMTKVGYTKTPRTHIVYNSIVVPNGETNMNDSEIQKLVKRNNELQEEIGVLKNQSKQFNKRLKEKDKEIKDIKESYSDADDKLKEYDSLKKIEASYNQMISSKREDLIHQICGKDKKKAEKFSDYSVEQLETTVELLKGKKGAKGVTPQTTDVDDGSNPTPQKEDDDEYTDEMFEEEFKQSGL